MQGSLRLHQRLSLQSFATLLYRTFGTRSVGSCRFPHWQALGFGNPRASNSALQSVSQRRSPGVVHDLLLQEIVTRRGLSFVGNTGHTSMRGSCFASTPSCSYKAEVTGKGLKWASATPGNSCGSVQKSSYGVPKPVQPHTTRQWLSLHTQGRYARKPVGQVAGKASQDFAADTVEEDEEDFVITEDEIVTAGIENELADEIEEELDDLDEDDDFWDDDEGDVVVGDGGTGGGVFLGGIEWGKKALDVAEQVVAECGKDFSIFAFKVSPDGVVRVRLDKLSDRYGSPTMTDIEVFSKRFSIALEESGEAGIVPKDIDVEVSTPGAERVVRVPNDLERFKELPMYVQYTEGETNQTEKDGVLELDSLDMEAGLSIWKIANVKLNREVKGKGRPLNNAQKKWRATIPLSSLKQVRLYLDV